MSLSPVQLMAQLTGLLTGARNASPSGEGTDTDVSPNGLADQFSAMLSQACQTLTPQPEPAGPPPNAIPAASDIPISEDLLVAENTTAPQQLLASIPVLSIPPEAGAAPVSGAVIPTGMEAMGITEVRPLPETTVPTPETATQNQPAQPVAETIAGQASNIKTEIDAAALNKTTDTQRMAPQEATPVNLQSAKQTTEAEVVLPQASSEQVLPEKVTNQTSTDASTQPEETPQSEKHDAKQSKDLAASTVTFEKNVQSADFQPAQVAAIEPASAIAAQPVPSAIFTAAHSNIIAHGSVSQQSPTTQPLPTTPSPNNTGASQSIPPVARNIFTPSTEIPFNQGIPAAPAFSLQQTEQAGQPVTVVTGDSTTAMATPDATISDMQVSSPPTPPPLDLPDSSLAPVSGSGSTEQVGELSLAASMGASGKTGNNSDTQDNPSSHPGLKTLDGPDNATLRKPREWEQEAETAFEIVSSPADTAAPEMTAGQADTDGQSTAEISAQITSAQGMKESATANAESQNTHPALKNIFHPNADGIADQVLEGAMHGIRGNQRELTVRLNPDNLGEVRINFISQASQNSQPVISARLIASTPESHEALQSQIQNLRNSLEAQGVHVDRISVVLAGQAENSNEFSQQFNQSSHQHNPQQDKPETSHQQQSHDQNPHNFFSQLGQHHQGRPHQQYAQAPGRAHYNLPPATESPAEISPSDRHHSDHRQGAHENGNISLLA